MKKIKALVIRAPGTNCDGEAVFAFELAGAEAQRVHINQIVRKEVILSDYHILVVPGGFSYGDDIASGKVFANEISLKLGEQVNRFVDDGRLILGICNGFQILMKAGLLPRLKKGQPQSVTRTNNDSGTFECRWVHLRVNPKSPCIFTKGMESMYVPVAHGEGKVTGDMTAIPSGNEVVYYVDDKGNSNPGYPWNPNGSERDIAGICDDSGRIFALMPHPERHVLGTQHPQWTRLGAKKFGAGFPIFQNAVKYSRSI